MKNIKIHIVFLLAASSLLAGCSTSKNTPMTRRFHAMTTKFNIAFNGNQSFKEGLESIEKANKDDYSQLLYLNPISNNSNASAATSNMNRVIEKSRKAIKLHSIKKKPKKDYSRIRDSEYMAFYNQNEFNPELKKSWIQLGQAEFYKGDFLGASGTFSFITRHYESTPEMVQKAKIWMARAYSELDWLYEADNILRKIKPEALFESNRTLHAVTVADLLIKQEQYRQAVSHLKKAITLEKDRKKRIRYSFVMAQLLERTDNKQEATDYYTQVLKSTPPYEMAFNAQINRTQLLNTSVQSLERELKGMIRKSSNKDFKDQIYTALGNIFMNNKDTVKAVKYYNQAIEESTRNGVAKGVPLVKMGDFYWNLKEYVKAFPYYDEAVQIYTVAFKDYKRISYRSEVLGELVKEHTVVALQDSLQQLANMSDADRLAAIQRTIEKVKEEEKRAKEKELIAQQPQQEDNFTMLQQPIGSNVGSWYFYNPQTISNGRNEFRRKWGNRKLEDNWRRANKSATLFTDNNEQTSAKTDSIQSENVLLGDSAFSETNEDIPLFKQTTDKKSVGYYMAQIPFKQAQVQKSNEQIATSLYNMGMIYKDKIEDYTLAYQTFEDFEHRFGNDIRMLETLYSRFLMASKEQNKIVAEKYRNDILSKYPDSKYAEMLQDPDFIRNQQEMIAKQDEIYNNTYKAFTKSDYDVVFKNTNRIKKHYPLSSLLPQFEFLNTLSIGKTKGAEEFEISLNRLVKNYPNNEISAMAKDILALLNQGFVAQEGNTFGTLLEKRETENMTTEEMEAMQFSELKFTPHRLMLITPANNETINKLQYNLAIFNFSRFMIRDFGFQLTPIDSKRRALSITNLASYNEGVWYKNTLATDKELVQLMDSLQVEPLIISEDNFGKLKTTFTLDEYIAFEENTLKKDIPEALLTASTNVPLYDTSIKTVEVKDGTNLGKKEKNKTEVAARAEKGKEPNRPNGEKIPKPKKNNDKNSAKPIKAEKKKIVDGKPKSLNNPTPATEKNKKQPIVKQKDPTTPNPISEVGNIVLSDTEYKIPTASDELYKNLFSFQPNAPHYVAFYIPQRGKYDFDTLKKAFAAYSEENYKMMNLKIWVEQYNEKSIIFIGAFADANVAKSYFMRVLKDADVRNATSGMNKRNLIVTRDNINTLLHENALDIYFDFLRAYYLR